VSDVINGVRDISMTDAPFFFLPGTYPLAVDRHGCWGRYPAKIMRGRLRDDNKSGVTKSARLKVLSEDRAATYMPGEFGDAGGSVNTHWKRGSIP
jgi:hypothetical protein